MIEMSYSGFQERSMNRLIEKLCFFSFFSLSSASKVRIFVVLYSCQDKTCGKCANLINSSIKIGIWIPWNSMHCYIICTHVNYVILYIYMIMVLVKS